MVDEETIVVNGILYIKDVFHKEHPGANLYTASRNPDQPPAVLCGVCQGSSFTISYGNYCVYAHCSCGNLMEIYSG